MSFIPLQVHSEYSLIDSILLIDDIVDYAKSANLESIALTDRNNSYGLLKFYKAARKAGIKPILGVDLTVRSEIGCQQIILLAKNNTGLKHINELISYAYEKDRRAEEIAVEKSRFNAEQCAGIVALSAGLEGEIAAYLARGEKDAARQTAEFYREVFGGDFYLQINRLTGTDAEIEYEKFAQELAQDGFLATAANPACFLREEDYRLHEIRCSISNSWILEDEDRPHNYSQNHRLRAPDEMQAIFLDAPELLNNSEAIAKMCNVELTLGKNFLPEFPLPDGISIDDYLRELARDGLRERLEFLYPDENLRKQKYPEYSARLERELDVIIQMKFPGYFLIVADFIRWAKDNAVPVGPGRGSGAGSLVAYCIKITDLDPLPYDLLFERFLNPERVSMPDFDVDFCMDKRDLVIRYVAQKYGLEKVSQIATHGTMGAKAVIRDVGRVLGIPFPECDRISKLIPKTLGVTLEDALNRTDRARENPEFASPELVNEYEKNAEVRRLVDSALPLEGLTRSVGKHAGGVVIAPTKLTDFSAIYCEDAGAPLVTQFDKDDIEAVGLVKFDFLGLRTLTVIDWALQMINQRRKAENLPEITAADIPAGDAETFALLQSAHTSAVFQLESSGMKNLIKKLQPDTFEDIIALVALFRPGPLGSGMVDDFINRKHGKAEVSYPHPALEPVLSNTYGVIVYQEQVMQIAQVLANYSLGGADLLRRAMGKKKPEVMAEQKSIFVKGAVENGVDAKLANDIFDLMAKFAEYGFNKSHSAAYALLSYQTAWLKCHYPAEFMAAVLTSDMDKTEKTVPMVAECFEIGLNVIPPDINRSEYRFSAADAKTVLYGLGAIKGVGEGPVKLLLTEREKNGQYKSLLDLCRRVNIKEINKNILEMLICAGAFDSIEPNRGALMHALPQTVKIAAAHHEQKKSAQSDLFGGILNETESAEEIIQLDLSRAWTRKEKLNEEKKALGMFLTDHPINEVAVDLKKICKRNLADIAEWLSGLKPPEERGKKIPVLCGGLISECRKKVFKNKKGEDAKVGFFTLEDRSAKLELRLSGFAFDKWEHNLATDNIVLLECNARYDFYRLEWSLDVQKISLFEDERLSRLRGISIEIAAADVKLEDLELLKKFRIREESKNPAELAAAEVVMDFQVETENALVGTIRLDGKYRLNEREFAEISEKFSKMRLRY
ncbi:MAG: DNA polymerase III subunit alpha [Cardiobacteriaceae bacterium]|nr:DNA polymerase III subunit alpha [Cardiobacteriaceae bacterium]